eukprot:7195554-Pyramimonas_sp.AAC.1
MATAGKQGARAAAGGISRIILWSQSGYACGLGKSWLELTRGILGELAGGGARGGGPGAPSHRVLLLRSLGVFLESSEKWKGQH